MLVSPIIASDGRHGNLNIVIDGYRIKGWQIESGAVWKQFRIRSAVALVREFGTIRCA